MRQKKGTILLGLGVVLLLFVTGCGDKVEDVSKSPFVGGSSGLQITFLKDSPPSEITDNNLFPFRIVLGVKNEGEFGLTKDMARIDLKGFLPTDFGVSKNDITNKNPESDPTPRQKDAEGNIIDPVETYVTIPPGAIDLNLGVGKISGNTEFIFRADVCYQYGSDAIAKICILENLISPAEDAICNPRGEKRVFSSSSPVKVTSFRESVAGADKIQFSFDIEHVGSGKVFKNIAPTALVGCPKDLTNKRREENLVHVTVDTGLSAGSLDCVGFTDSTTKASASKDVKLVNNKRTVTCTQTISDDYMLDLERNVDINLRFDYSDSIQKKVLAKHIEAASAAAAPSAPAPAEELATCGRPGTPSDSQCLSVRCNSDTLVSGTCAFTTLCTCASGSYACVGACTATSGVDNTRPIVGIVGTTVGTVIQPTISVQAPRTQFFVVQDVYDEESGIVSCKLNEPSRAANDPERSKEMTAQGPARCRDPGRPCDFVIDKSLGGGNTALEVECTNRAGLTNEDKKTKIITVKPAAPTLPSVPETDSTPPEVGRLLTNVVVKDSYAFIIVGGIQDPHSGVKSCQLRRPGALEPVGTMTLQGPLGCWGTGTEGSGPCTAYIQHKFETAGTDLSYFVVCTNGADVSNPNNQHLRTITVLP